MAKETKSNTEKVTSLFESLVEAAINTPEDAKGHYRTTITDGDHKVDYDDDTSEGSQKGASEKWHNRK